MVLATFVINSGVLMGFVAVNERSFSEERK
jgi:hypothetical protein